MAEELIKEGDKYYRKLEVDIDGQIADELAAKTLLLEQLALRDARINELQAMKGE